MKTLTVFTPSYNRAYTLHKCYESLLRQTSKDFTWLIIDDGSSDNTKELVDSWINENKKNHNIIKLDIPDNNYIVPAIGSQYF